MNALGQVWAWWRRQGAALVDAAADVGLGSTCPGCGVPGWRVCATCVSALRWPTPVRSLAEIMVIAACGYRPPVPAMIKAWKDHGRWSLTGDFADAVAARVHADPPWWWRPAADWLIVPAPSRPATVRSRGHDHAAALARALARRWRLPTEPLLTRAQTSADQFELDRAGRVANLRGSVRAQTGQGRVVLVDDVVTTGSTLLAGCEALSAAGWSVMGAVTVASSELRATGLAQIPDTDHKGG